MSVGKWFAFDDSEDGLCDGPFDTEAAARVAADENGWPNVGQRRLLTVDDFPFPFDVDDALEAYEENRDGDDLALETIGATNDDWNDLREKLAETWAAWVGRVLAREGRRATIIDWKAAEQRGAR